MKLINQFNILIINYDMTMELPNNIKGLGLLVRIAGLQH